MTEIIQFVLAEAEDWKEYVSPPGPREWDTSPIEIPGVDDCAVIYSVSTPDGKDTMYIRVQDDNHGNWYYQMTLDCDTGHFCVDYGKPVGPFADYGKPVGPFKSHSEAALAAYNPKAITWFIENGVKYIPDAGLEHLLDQKIRSQMAESMGADEFKELYAPGEEKEYSMAQIKSSFPKFFNRENNRHFGTRKIYKYKGNYIVLKNVRRRHGHFGNVDYYTDYVIYKFKKSPDSEEGDLICKGSSRDLDDAKWMIKNQNFRSRLERLEAGII